MDAKLTLTNVQVPQVELAIDVSLMEIESENKQQESLQTSSSSSSFSSSPTAVTTTKQSLGSLVLSNCQVGYFRISLSLCAQALLWKTLIHFIQENDDHPLHHLAFMLPSTALILLWSLALFTLVVSSLIYLLKCLFLFDSVKEEFFHHVGVNYFFAPWMSCLLLLHAAPFSKSTDIYYRLFWWVFVVPIVLLDIKIYGEWFTKGKRFLSRVANPASQLSVIANLVAARASMEMGRKEEALCLFSLGMAHYLVLFVTLYQRLPGGDGLPMILRPVFFLFVATPSMAGLAWGSINGRFDIAAKMLFCLSFFLFLSLVCRPTLFKKSMSKFSVAWWAYCFSVTLLAMASIEYADEVKAGAAHVIMLVLSAISILVLFVLLIFTVINANTLLFGRDIKHVNAITGSADGSANKSRQQNNSSSTLAYATGQISS